MYNRIIRIMNLVTDAERIHIDRDHVFVETPLYKVEIGKNTPSDLKIMTNNYKILICDFCLSVDQFSCLINALLSHIPEIIVKISEMIRRHGFEMFFYSNKPLVSGVRFTNITRLKCPFSIPLHIDDVSAIILRIHEMALHFNLYVSRKKTSETPVDIRYLVDETFSSMNFIDRLLKKTPDLLKEVYTPEYAEICKLLRTNEPLQDPYLPCPDNSCIDGSRGTTSTRSMLEFIEETGIIPKNVKNWIAKIILGRRNTDW